MKTLWILLLIIVVNFSCASCTSRNSNEFTNDLSQGERLYRGIVGMNKINSYPEYAEVDSARSAYYIWKTRFIKNYGLREWDAFILRMKQSYGNPNPGYEFLLESKTM